MKIICAFVVILAVAHSMGASIQGQLMGNQQLAGQPSENQQQIADNLESLRVRKDAKSAYPSSSYSAPPCPTNYLFSCGPQLKPVPCSPPSYSGAYSENVPQYILPQHMIPPPYGYPQYAYPVITEV